MNVPKLRFKEFTGEYLEEKVSNVCYISTGKSNTQDKVEDGEYPFYVRSAIIERSNKYLYDEEAVLTVGDGVGTGKTYHYVNGKYDLHQRVYRMFDFKNVLGKYFYYYFTEHFYKRVAKMSAKNSVDSVRLNMIADMPIMLPCVEEQEKVSDFISYVDDKIKVLQRTIISLENQKSALLGKFFSQELRFKDENGKDFPAWEEKKLGEVGSFTKGGSLSKADLSDDGIECVLYGELYTRYSEIAEKIVSKTNVDKTALCMSRKNDVILPSSGETPEDISTATCILKDGVALGGDIIVYRSELLEGRFNSYLLNHKCKMDIARIAQGKSVVHINANALKNILVPVPCLEEQNKIVEFLFSMNKKMENTIETLEHWKQIKKGLLQQMFV